MCINENNNRSDAVCSHEIVASVYGWVVIAHTQGNIYKNQIEEKHHFSKFEFPYNLCVMCLCLIFFPRFFVLFCFTIDADTCTAFCFSQFMPCDCKNHKLQCRKCFVCFWRRAKFSCIQFYCFPDTFRLNYFTAEYCIRMLCISKRKAKVRFWFTSTFD